MKLFVYEAVKCEGINVDYLRRDLPVNNSAIMVKWKCLKLLYSPKGMCRIDSQLKKIDVFEIFNSWNTLYLFLYIGGCAGPSITGIVHSWICKISVYWTNKMKNTVIGKTADWMWLGKKQVIVLGIH